MVDKGMDVVVVDPAAFEIMELPELAGALLLEAAGKVIRAMPAP